MGEKEKLLQYIENFNTDQSDSNHNRMGCSELWYNPYFGVMQSFSIDEIKMMEETEITNLLKVAETVGEGLF